MTFTSSESYKRCKQDHQSTNYHFTLYQSCSRWNQVAGREILFSFFPVFSLFAHVVEICKHIVSASWSFFTFAYTGKAKLDSKSRNTQSKFDQHGLSSVWQNEKATVQLGCSTFSSIDSVNYLYSFNLHHYKWKLLHLLDLLISAAGQC